MGLLQRLKHLDSKVLPGARRPGETAEHYLRRLASQGPADSYKAADVNQALREYFRDLDA